MKTLSHCSKLVPGELFYWQSDVATIGLNPTLRVCIQHDKFSEAIQYMRFDVFGDQLVFKHNYGTSTSYSNKITKIT